ATVVTGPGGAGRPADMAATIRSPGPRPPPAYDRPTRAAPGSRPATVREPPLGSSLVGEGGGDGALSEAPGGQAYGGGEDQGRGHRDEGEVGHRHAHLGQVAVVDQAPHAQAEWYAHDDREHARPEMRHHPADDGLAWGCTDGPEHGVVAGTVAGGEGSHDDGVDDAQHDQ